MDELFTVREVSKMLKVSRQTMWLIRKAGKIKETKVGNSTRFTKQSVEDFISENTKFDTQPQIIA